MSQTVTPDILRTLLDYDPQAGTLTWKQRDATWFKSEAAMRGWNTRFAGKIAGTFNVCSGYRIVAVLAQYIYAHRIAYAMHHGEWPEITDHINGIRDDNRIANLRSVSDLVNKKNLKRPVSNTSGTAGVHWDKRNSKWRADIHVGRRSINLGRFDSKDAATAARAAALQEHGFHENHGRGIAA